MDTSTCIAQQWVGNDCTGCHVDYHCKVIIAKWIWIGDRGGQVQSWK